MSVSTKVLSSYDEINKILADLNSNLEKSDHCPEPAELEREGFELQSVFRLEVPEDAVERTVEVYENDDGEHIVLHEVFHDREGGMYQNAAFASEERVLQWLKPRIEQSLSFPNQYLVESVLRVNFINAAENPFRDSSNSYGCAHFKWILKDKDKQKKVLQLYLKNNDLDNLIGREKEIYRAAGELYAQLNSK